MYLLLSSLVTPPEVGRHYAECSISKSPPPEGLSPLRSGLSQDARGNLLIVPYNRSGVEYVGDPVWDLLLVFHAYLTLP
jgi:hypothetical protein